MPKNALVLFLLTALVTGTLSAQSFEYRINGKDDSAKYLIQVSPAENGYSMSIAKPNPLDSSDAQLNTDFSTRRYEIIDPSTNTDLVCAFGNNEIIFSGTLKGVAVNRKFNANGLPFYHNFSFQLRYFAVKGPKETKFMTINPETFESHEFYAVKEKQITFDFNGVPTLAWKIKAGPTGIGALFWSVNGFYRVSDGLFLGDDMKAMDNTPIMSGLSAESAIK